MFTRVSLQGLVISRDKRAYELSEKVLFLNSLKEEDEVRSTAENVKFNIWNVMRETKFFQILSLGNFNQNSLLMQLHRVTCLFDTSFSSKSLTDS